MTADLMPENSKTIPFRTRDEVEARAEQVLHEHDMFKMPVDPIRLAQLLRIKVYNAKFADDSISGMLAKRGPNVTMLINASDSSHRKRFTIAHELGHRVLGHFENDAEHLDWSKDLFRSSPASGDEKPGDRAEIQANQFAAALLMPAKLVRSTFDNEKDVDRLAKLFQVSAEAMGYRLQTLGLV